MAGEIQLNGTTALTESGGVVTLNNVDSATNRTNLGLGSAATSATGDFEASGAVSTHAAVTSNVHGISAFGATLVDDADAGTARTTLGLGTAATSASTDFVGASRTITAGTGLSGGGDLSANRTISVDYASTSEVQGTHTTFSGSHSDTATTINLASVSGISAGDYVVGEGITPGTTVSSVGASSVVISAGLDTDGVGIAGGEPISFYKSTKALSPGLVAGGLCRAYVNFNGTGTVAIRAAYNVSSITDRGQGLYEVNFATAMPDDNYVISTTAGNETASTNVFGQFSSYTISNGMQTTSVAVASRNATTFTDLDHFLVAVFR